jgi:PLP dependent protein
MTIAENLAQVRANIAAASERAGRDSASVTLIAVSKTRPPAAILEAAAAGVQHFGENRVEEAVDKIPAVRAELSAPLVWHMIGHLQSRKAKEAPPLFDIVHSVDTVKLAEKLSQAALAQKNEQSLDILLEVNVSGEVSKSGFSAAGWRHNAHVRNQIWQDVTHIAALPGLKLRGLMTMAPIVEDMKQARPVFASLAQLRVALMESLNTPLPDLSMGMTDDYPVAIEEGATLIRIGRAIFGERERF